jgi:hypothetical protein
MAPPPFGVLRFFKQEAHIEHVQPGALMPQQFRVRFSPSRRRFLTVSAQNIMTTHYKTKFRAGRASSINGKGGRAHEGSVNTRTPDEESATEPAGSGIRWITDKELAQASQELRRLKRFGRQVEQRGDYFVSGNIAYQLRQIVAEIQALVRGTSRVERRN